MNQHYCLKTTKPAFTSEPEIAQLEVIISVEAIFSNGENKHSSFSRNCIVLASFFIFFFSPSCNCLIRCCVMQRGLCSDASTTAGKKLFRMVLCEEEGNSQAVVLTELLEGRCEAACGGELGVNPLRSIETGNYVSEARLGQL